MVFLLICYCHQDYLSNSLFFLFILCIYIVLYNDRIATYEKSDYCLVLFFRFQLRELCHQRYGERFIDRGRDWEALRRTRRGHDLCLRPSHWHHSRQAKKVIPKLKPLVLACGYPEHGFCCLVFRFKDQSYSIGIHDTLLSYLLYTCTNIQCLIKLKPTYIWLPI